MTDKNSFVTGKTLFNRKSPMSIQWRLICTLLLVLPIMSIFISIIAALPLYQKISSEEDQDLQRFAKLLVDDVKPNKDGQGFLNQDLAQELGQDANVFDEFYELEDLVSDSSLSDQPFIYAIWNNQGRLIETEQEYNFNENTIFNDDVANNNNNNKNEPIHHAQSVLTFKRHNGFVNTDMRFKPEALRVYYHVNPHSGETIAVAQKWQYRLTYMKTMVIEQLTILLFILPFLVLVLIWSVHYGLRPLNDLAMALHKRHAHDLAPMTNPVPTELQPLIESLNQLFIRVSDTINREQRFTADAAHELRSPITAIKLQSNELVFSLSNVDNNQDAFKSLQRIQQVANRASHLIDQLLTLAQLDNSQQGLLTHKQDSQQSNREVVDWLQVSEEALQSVSLYAREKNVRLKRHQTSELAEHILPVNGDATLLTLLLRNLLDNAIRYGGQGSVVELILGDDVISVRDHGKGIDEGNLKRVKERFFRPAGQTQMGSGLGLSIVERIADMHQLILSIDNHVDGGVVATIKTS